MKNSYDYVEEAVKQYWEKTYPQDVIVFFYQKYDLDTKWEWCEELVECRSDTDSETVIFHNDFCEGQTCVRNITVVSLSIVTEYFTQNVISKCIKNIGL